MVDEFEAEGRSSTFEAEDVRFEGQELVLRQIQLPGGPIPDTGINWVRDLPDEVEDGLAEIVGLERLRDEGIGSTFIGTTPGLLFGMGR